MEESGLQEGQPSLGQVLLVEHVPEPVHAHDFGCLRPENPLIPEVVDGEDGGNLTDDRIVLHRSLDERRYRSGLPVVDVDDVRPGSNRREHLEGGLGPGREADVLVGPVGVDTRPVEQGGDVQKERLGTFVFEHLVVEGEVAGPHGPRPQVFTGFEVESVDHPVEGGDRGDAMTGSFQSDRKSARHVGESSRLGEGHDLARQESDVEGSTRHSRPSPWRTPSGCASPRGVGRTRA